MEAQRRAGRLAAAALAANRVVPIERECVHCGETYPLTAEHWYVARRDSAGRITRLDSPCKGCRRAYQRDRYHSDPERRADAIARAEEHRQADEALRLADPEYAERRRAEWRAYNAAYRERKRRGSEPRPIRLTPRVPARPLAALLDAEIARARSGANTAAGVGGTGGKEPAVADLLDRLGVSERLLYSWRTGEREGAQFDRADALLTRLEVLWWEAYDPERFPDLYSPSEWIDVVDAASRAWTGESLLAAA